MERRQSTLWKSVRAAAAVSAAGVVLFSAAAAQAEPVVGAASVAAPKAVASAPTASAGARSVPLSTGGRLVYKPEAAGTAVPMGSSRSSVGGGALSISFGWGVYVQLTPDEQSLLITGDLAVLNGALCGIGTPAACAAAGPAFTAARGWLIDHGRCGTMEIKIIPGPPFDVNCV